MNALKAELDDFMVDQDVRSNPPLVKLYEFLEEISENGTLLNYSEQDWVEAGRSYGLSDDEISNWIETAASWVEDTTEEGKYEPEQAAWVA